MCARWALRKSWPNKCIGAEEEQMNRWGPKLYTLRRYIGEALADFSNFESVSERFELGGKVWS